MKIRMKKFLYIILLVLLANKAESQDNRLTLQFRRILFKDLADTIEKTIPVKIYYTNKWVDSLYLNVKSDNEPLNTLFDKSISKNGLSFIITDDNKLILSKGYTIKTNFKKEYLEYLEKNLTKTDTTTYTRSEPKKAEDLLINDEYKIFKIGNPSGQSTDGRAISVGDHYKSDNRRSTCRGSCLCGEIEGWSCNEQRRFLCC